MCEAVENSSELSGIYAFLIVDGSKVFMLTKGRTTIGRSTRNDLILPYPQVSRKHAVIHYQDGNFEVEDQNSMGGTYLNGNQITNSLLQRGDVITLADVHLVFGQEPPAVPGNVAEYQPPQEADSTDIQTKSIGDSNG